MTGSMGYMKKTLKKYFRDFLHLNPDVQVTIFGVLGLDAVLKFFTYASLYRRPRRRVRGNKSGWVAFSFVPLVGPIAYLTSGRK